MLPLNVPAVVRPAVLTDTVKLAGVLPPPGDTLSHVFPEVTEALTLVLFGDDVIVNVWEAGAWRPTV
jgi:hypothetical protein